ncbi:MAG: EamA family transporter [Phycisphaerae bacterium]
MNAAWLWLMVAMGGWGLGVLLMKLATRGVDPLTAIAFNLPGYLLVGLLVVPWARPGLSRYHLAAVAVGAAYVVGNFAFYKLCKSQPISILAPLASLYVAIPIIAGVMLLAERPTRLQWAGIVLAAVAVVMLTWPSSRVSRAKVVGKPATGGRPAASSQPGQTSQDPSGAPERTATARPYRADDRR